MFKVNSRISEILIKDVIITEGIIYSRNFANSGFAPCLHKNEGKDDAAATRASNINNTHTDRNQEP